MTVSPEMVRRFCAEDVDQIQGFTYSERSVIIDFRNDRRRGVELWSQPHTDNSGRDSAELQVRLRFERTRAALTAALSDQAGGWQDISTAPKHNRVFVDLWFPQRDIGEYGRIPDCQYLANETAPGWYAWNEEADALYYIGDGATHWMFRPKAPPSPAGGG